MTTTRHCAANYQRSSRGMCSAFTSSPRVDLPPTRTGHGNGERIADIDIDND
jgi:hypothetical protein